MKKLLLTIFRWYFSHFFIRTGKIPLLNLLTKLGLTKNVELISSFDDGILIHLDLDDWIQKQIFFFGRYEIEKLQTLFWKQNLKDGQIVLDIGANVGYYSLMAAKRINKGTVYAFEPVRDTFDKLENNINLNRFTNIKAYNLAVSDRAGTLQLFPGDHKNTGTSSIRMHKGFSGKLEMVDAITVDEFVARENIFKADFIKIDVEGSEMNVLKGMKLTLEKLSPVVLIELLEEKLENAGSSVKEIYQLFIGMGYKPYNINNKLYLEPISEPAEGSLIVFKKDQISL